MIRPFTVLCLLAALGSGAYLYTEKHRTELVDRDIGRSIHATEAARARTGVLRAEWALLNEPGRLQNMAGRYLALHPMSPSQFVQIGDLASHLPAPLAPLAAGAADEDDVPAPDAVVADTSAANAAVTSVAAPPAPHPVQGAHGDTKPTARMLASAAAHGHTSRHAMFADRQDSLGSDGPMARGTPLPLAAPQPIRAGVYSAMAHPMRLAGRTAASRVVAAVPNFASAQPFVQSALGGGTQLPPPVPYVR